MRRKQRDLRKSRAVAVCAGDMEALSDIEKLSLTSGGSSIGSRSSNQEEYVSRVENALASLTKYFEQGQAFETERNQSERKGLIGNNPNDKGRAVATEHEIVTNKKKALVIDEEKGITPISDENAILRGVP